MKNVTKPDYWKESPIMTPDQLKVFAQKMYDKLNFSGLSSEEHNKYNHARRLYKEKTGNGVVLEYNCPA